MLERLELAASAAPADYQGHQGWVLTAFQNAFWQLLHAPDLESGVCETVRRGGDTDTNAAIAGALLERCTGSMRCRSSGFVGSWPAGRSGGPCVHRPRPKPFWPVDALVVAEELAGLAMTADATIDG